MSSLRIPVACAMLLIVLGTPVAEAKGRRRSVQATQGKRYLLHKDHDPWMIMVTSLRDVDPMFRVKGMSAWEAADSIIYELRKKGIPAYAYHQKEQMDERGRYVERQEYIAILAGSFKSPDDRLVKPVLEYIQTKYQPACLKAPAAGAVVARGQDESKPFRRAFVTPNPLKSDAELGRDVVDPLIVKLNSGSGEVSLLENPGRFSVKVATFSGNAVVQVAGKEDQSHFKLFKERFGRGVGEAGVSAWELATALRQAGRLGYGHDYDAWVYHDRYKSYVTIGSFSRPDDPRIAELQREFEGKFKPNPKTGAEEMTPELFSIPKNPHGQALPDKLWFFDQQPRVISVPGT